MGLAKAEGIIALQEVHGNDAIWRSFSTWLQQRFFIFASFSQSLAKGGVVTLLSRWDPTASGPPCPDEFSSEVLIPGRVLRVEFFKQGRRFVHWNIHAHAFTLAQTSIFAPQLKQDLAAAKSDPLRFFVVVMGDMNAHAEDSVKRYLSDPGRSSSRPLLLGEKRLQEAFSEGIEITGKEETHFSAKLRRRFPPSTAASWAPLRGCSPSSRSGGW